MSTAPVTPAPKQSWLSKFGHKVGQILGVIAKDAEPVEKVAAATATALLPQFSSEIAYADNLATRILQQVSTTEGAFVAVGQSTNGPAKLQAVVQATSDEMNQWVTNNFGGSAQISDASKAGLVNAIVAIANDVDSSLSLVNPTPAAVGAASAAKSAVAAAKQ